MDVLPEEADQQPVHGLETLHPPLVALQNFVAVVGRPCLLVLVLPQHRELVEPGIEGIGLVALLGTSLLLVGPHAGPVEIDHYEVQEFCEGVDDPGVVLVEAVEEGDDLEEDVLEEAEVGEPPHHVQHLPEDRGLVGLV